MVRVGGVGVGGQGGAGEEADSDQVTLGASSPAMFCSVRTCKSEWIECKKLRGVLSLLPPGFKQEEFGRVAAVHITLFGKEKVVLCQQASGKEQ